MWAIVAAARDVTAVRQSLAYGCIRHHVALLERGFQSLVKSTLFLAFLIGCHDCPVHLLVLLVVWRLTV